MRVAPISNTNTKQQEASAANDTKEQNVEFWGKNDPSFIWAGAEAFGKDLPKAKIVSVNSGHFALENCCREIAEQIRAFF